MKDIMIIIKKEAIVDIIKKIARIIIKIIEINLFWKIINNLFDGDIAY